MHLHASLLCLRQTEREIVAKVAAGAVAEARAVEASVLTSEHYSH